MNANNFESRFKTNLKRFANENNIDVDDIDELNSLLVENATLHELYSESEYIHINIPTGADAIAEYEKAIDYVNKLDVKKMDSAIPNHDNLYLSSLLRYFKGIRNVYDRTDFVISNSSEIEDLKIDGDAIHGIYISSQEKYLLNKAIDKLIAKKIEVDEYQSKLIDEYTKQYYEKCMKEKQVI